MIKNGLIMIVPKKNNGIWRHSEYLNDVKLIIVETICVCLKMDIKKCKKKKDNSLK